MKKTIYKFIGIFVIAFLMAFFNFKFDHQTINSMYQVLGIIFSIGMGLLITFRLDGVKNHSYIKEIRNNVERIRNSFILYFLMSTLFYMTYQKVPDNILNLEVFKINTATIMNHFSMYLIVFSMVYCIVNFLSIQKLNDDIFDRVNKELQRR